MLSLLTDPQAKEQVKDRLSFQKFVQLDAHETVPDKTKTCRFRQRLIECGLHEQLLGLLNTQLEARGYTSNASRYGDAKLVASNRKHATVLISKRFAVQPKSYRRTFESTFCDHASIPPRRQRTFSRPCPMKYAAASKPCLPL